ncbi:MAG: cupin domain-containing protein [Acidimicrobiales bacterium]
MALIGLVVVGLSARALLVALRQNESPARGHQAAVVTPNQLATVTTADLVYEPGHSSGWHVHPGLHAVVVLSGTLTVYDQACSRHDYGPGQTYLSGREPHVARNESDEPTRMVAAYVPDGRADRPGSSVAAPGGCQAVA